MAVTDGVGVFEGVFDSEDPGESELVGDGVPVPVPVRVLVGVGLGVLDGPGNKQKEESTHSAPFWQPPLGRLLSQTKTQEEPPWIKGEV